MWSNSFRKMTYIFLYELRSIGVIAVFALEVFYFMKFLNTDCQLLGGTAAVTITGFLALVFSEQHFLTFMLPLGITLGVNSLSRTRMIETMMYRNRDCWVISLIKTGTFYVAIFYVSTVALSIIMAWIFGISFSAIELPNDAMQFVIPGLLTSVETVDMLELIFVNMGNVFFYCETIMMGYVFLWTIAGKRFVAILLEICALFGMLIVIKTYVRGLYMWLPLGNVILDLSTTKPNTEIHWIYWIALIGILFVLTILIHRKRSFYQDE